MFYWNKHSVSAFVADKYHFRETGLCAPPMFAACTSSDEPFSTLKRPALWMAPSASLEISWEETKRETCLESLTPDGAWLAADIHVSSINTAELCQHYGWKAEPQKHHPHVIGVLLFCHLHIYTLISLTPFTVKCVFLALFSPHSIYQLPSISSELSVPYLSLADSSLSAEVKYWQEEEQLMLEEEQKK